VLTAQIVRRDATLHTSASGGKGDGCVEGCRAWQGRQRAGHPDAAGPTPAASLWPARQHDTLPPVAPHGARPQLLQPAQLPLPALHAAPAAHTACAASR
jgi:hypothetical protein